MFCGDTVFIEISYDTCAFGTPVQFAAISAADSSVCPTAGQVQLSGTPAGGTFSGMGVSGSQFNPAGLATGNYTLSYTATDAIGCQTTGDVVVTIEPAPMVMPQLVCPGSTATLTAVGSNFIWFGDAALMMPLDTARFFTTPALLQPTNYYVQRALFGEVFIADALLSTNAAQVDHNTLTGDDRSGIAVSDSFIFVVGDGNTGRYNHDLTNPISLPINDGIFSNVANNTVWTLHNGTAAPSGTFVATYTVSELRQLNNMLVQTGSNLTLSTPITLNCNNSDCGIMAGANYLGLYSNDDAIWYIVDLTTGGVTSMAASTTTQLYGTENWANWGALERDGADFYAVYHNNNGNITRQMLPNGTPTNVVVSGNLGDMSSLVIVPSLNRWYGHYEAGSFFGAGGSEILGYADATTQHYTISGIQGVGCANVLMVDVPSIDLGADTVACEGDLYTIFAGLGYNSYTWNGVNNNFNAFSVIESGTYNVAVADDNGCTLRDTIMVTFNTCVGVTRNEAATFSIYPNPTKGDFTIATNDFNSQGDLRVDAFDATGRLVFSQNLGVINGQFNQNLSLAGFASGFYTIRLSDAKQSESFKLMLAE
jgi:hypothetical protein